MARKLQTCRIFYAGKERAVARRSYAPPPPRRPNLVISNIDRTPASNGYMTDTENESDTDTDPSRDYFTTDYSSDSDSDAEPPQHVPRVFHFNEIPSSPEYTPSSPPRSPRSPEVMLVERMDVPNPNARTIIEIPSDSSQSDSGSSSSEMRVQKRRKYNPDVEQYFDVEAIEVNGSSDSDYYSNSDFDYSDYE